MGQDDLAVHSRVMKRIKSALKEEEILSEKNQELSNPKIKENFEYKDPLFSIINRR